jgi:hypothetical protein
MGDQIELTLTGCTWIFTTIYQQNHLRNSRISINNQNRHLQPIGIREFETREHDEKRVSAIGMMLITKTSTSNIPAAERKKEI